MYVRICIYMQIIRTLVILQAAKPHAHTNLLSFLIKHETSPNL